MVVAVIVEVAPLAHRPQVTLGERELYEDAPRVVAVLRFVVEVRRRQPDPRAGPRMGVPVMGQASVINRRDLVDVVRGPALAAALALTPGPTESDR